ncbi:MAG: hypothetical protein ACRBFS_16650 [Aureispira sp.]
MVNAFTASISAIVIGQVAKAIDGFIEKAGAWFKDKKGRRKAKKDKKIKRTPTKADKESHVSTAEVKAKLQAKEKSTYFCLHEGAYSSVEASYTKKGCP